MKATAKELADAMRPDKEALKTASDTYDKEVKQVVDKAATDRGQVLPENVTSTQVVNNVPKVEFKPSSLLAEIGADQKSVRDKINSRQADQIADINSKV